MAKKIPVAILGAESILGQQLVNMLTDHPWFEVKEVLGAPDIEGNIYKSCPWYVDSDIPENVANLTLLPYDTMLDSLLVISTLPEEAAREYETKLARNGHYVVSTSSAFRMSANVPLLVPEINPDHIGMLDKQQQEEGWEGFIVSMPGSTTISLSLPLRILQEEFGLKNVVATTMQGIADDANMGMRAINMTDNIIPYPESEDILLELEPTKVLGLLEETGRFRLHPIHISAQANRVPMMVGHMVSASVELDREAKVEDVIKLFETWAPPKICDKLPSSPDWPLIYRYEEDRPQPRIDKLAENGMAWTVGRLRRCGVFHLRFVIAVNNIVRCGAGGAIQIAELLKTEGRLK